MTIVFTGRLALTNSGCNAHVFHYVRHSKSVRLWILTKSNFNPSSQFAFHE